MATMIEFEIEESLLDRIDEAAAKIGISRAVLSLVRICSRIRPFFTQE